MSSLVQATAGLERISIEVSVKGRPRSYPALRVDGNTLFVTGTWPRIARIRDEEWLDRRAIADPARLVDVLRVANAGADLFTFAQRVPDLRVEFPYRYNLESIAAACTSDYERWWTGLPQETRKNVRRAGRRGVTVRAVPFDGELLRGIGRINNETPVRQGRRFWHYGKSVDVVAKEYSTFLDRCDFIGAYCDDGLIGFIKLVHLGDSAAILQLLCMNKHADKRPANALIAEAVRICTSRRLGHLLYGKFIYGRNTGSPLTEFKRRNGFAECLVPRYYVPLNAAGALALRLGMQISLKQRLPHAVLDLARRGREKLVERRLRA
jgi:hypothetical protein